MPPKKVQEEKAKFDPPKLSKNAWRDTLRTKLKDMREQVDRAQRNELLANTAGDDEVFRALDEIEGAIENAREALARTRK